MNRLEEVTDASVPSLIEGSSSSSSSATKKISQPAALFPHKLLYPMKEAQHDSGKKGSEEDQATVLVPQTCQTWLGLTPLEMIQKIVSLAESKSPNFGAGLRGSSLRAFLTIDGGSSADASCGKKRKGNKVEEEHLGSNGDADDDLAKALVESHGKVKLPTRVFNTFGLGLEDQPHQRNSIEISNLK